MTDPIRLSDHRSNQPRPVTGPVTGPGTGSVTSTVSGAAHVAHSEHPGSEQAGDHGNDYDGHNGHNGHDGVTAGPGVPYACDGTDGPERTPAHDTPAHDTPAHDTPAHNTPGLPQVVNTTSTTGPLRLAEHPLNPSVTDKPIAWLCGVHGGAGVSTLTGVLAPFKDSGGLIPAADDPNTTILVAATHKAGLRALHEAVLQFTSGASGPAELLGVIIVDHTPGKLPKALAGDVQRIREATPSHNLWHINYIPAWRCARLRELPSWTPTPPGTPPQAATGSGKTTLSRARRRDHADALRHVPEALATDAQDMFERALRLYQRLNP